MEKVSLYESLDTTGECIVTQLSDGNVEKVFFYDSLGFPCRMEFAFRIHIQILDAEDNLISEEIGFAVRE